MRKITIVFNDTNGIQVEMFCDDITKQFFTKREFDQALRAAKLKYRELKREFRRDQILRQANVIGDTHGQTSKPVGHERSEQKQPAVNGKGKVSNGAIGSLQAAIAAKTDRNRREKAREASGRSA